MSLERFSLQGKVAVVTGASRGIGRAIAVGFAQAGADVAVAARSAPDLDALVDEIEGTGTRGLAVPTDVTERAQIEALIDRTVSTFGGIDILVNNAGGTRFMAPIVALRPEGWDKAMRLNLDSVFHATQLAAQRMVERGGGSIIQVSSIAGLEGAQGLSFYSAAKGGVRLLSQAVAKELATSKVRVNSIAPGWVATDLNANMRQDEASDRFITDMIPMGRWGDVDEIVGAAIFLASDAASFVTGTTLVVDGGQTA
ncbi:MAG TPA: SDR family NAD(P)-dependent oxidoreductase [Actinomycetota bacterium]|jgi:NAD(P)-dependent dehydrogenase (short-subunit alcohol dehydrogenase family)|nr:SDR family NAD(P)-dependent oxidoreductase [Actinomycetota bacterium]